MNTTINNKIACNEPHANLDSYYGPYESKAQALEALDTQTIAGVTYTKRAIGLTVGVTENGEVVEYWFKSGTTDNDLVKKITDSSMPRGVKIVTFDGSDGGRVTGGQNSLLTDTNGGVTLPQPTITRDGYTFECWRYNNHDYNPGDYIMVLVSTVVSAKWIESQTTYSVTFTAGSGVRGITATANGVSFNSGASFNPDTRIELTADIPGGYTLTWTGAPSGAVESGNTLSFVLSDNVNITATAQEVVTNYTVRWVEPTGATITATCNGTTFNNGDPCPAGSTIILTGTADSGYHMGGWSHYPPSAQVTGSTLTFTLTTNVSGIEANVARMYTISWTNPANATINGFTGNVPIYNGASRIDGTSIRLVATPNSGYAITSWTNKPSGSTESGNELTFTLNSNVSGVSVNVEQIPQFKVNFAPGDDKIQDVKGETSDGAPINDDDDILDENTEIIFTATPEDGYNVKWEGEGIPQDAIIEGEHNEILTFKLVSDVIVKPIGESIEEETFYYYSCGEENGANGLGEVVSGDEAEGEGSGKYFETIEELTQSEGSSAEIADNKGTIIYMITKENNVPVCLVKSETINFVPLNECDDNEIIDYFNEKGWVNPDSNETNGDLKVKGNYIFILIDAKLLKATVTLSILKEEEE